MLDGAFWPCTGTAASLRRSYAWNSLPGDLVNINLTVITFRRHLGPSSPHPTRCPFILHVHDWWFEALYVDENSKSVHNLMSTVP